MSCLRLYWDIVVELGFKLTPVLLAGRLCQGLGAPGMEAAMTAGTEHQVWGPNWPGQGAPANPAQVLFLAVRRPPGLLFLLAWAGLAISWE